MPNRDSLDTAVGCFFIVVFLLAILFALVLLAALIAGIDLAYENWG